MSKNLQCFLIHGCSLFAKLWEDLHIAVAYICNNNTHGDRYTLLRSLLTNFSISWDTPAFSCTLQLHCFIVPGEN
ncbi:unnamed protein product, partial [Nesidiocoris tenuis]